jgi:hypothetical protein
MKDTPKFKSAKKAFPSFTIKVIKREIQKLKNSIKLDEGYASYFPKGSDRRKHFEDKIIHQKDLLAGWESDLQKKENK